MARKAKTKKAHKDKSLFELVEDMRATTDEKRVLHKLHHSKHPLIKRAFRIHRHLRALEAEILANAGRGCVSLSDDPLSERIVLTIRNDELHCCRFAYLSKRELRMLEEEAKVAKELRACPAYEDVA